MGWLVTHRHSSQDQTGRHRSEGPPRSSRVPIRASHQSAECCCAVEVHRRPAGPSLGRINTYLSSPRHRRPPGHQHRPARERRNMMDWPTQDETLIKQFVNQLNLACYTAPYRSLLRQFQRFVVQRSPKPIFSEAVLRAWLRDQLKTAPLALAVHRGQLVNRFLDWLAARESIATNPIAELRRKYECRSSAAVLRALASGQPAKALESLRPPPRYGSHLGPIMREHVNRMRTRGLRYRHENRFLHFDRFLQQRPGADQEPLTMLVREYAAGASSAAGKIQRIQLGRVIAKELNRSGLAVAAPKRDRGLVQEMLRG